MVPKTTIAQGRLSFEKVRKMHSTHPRASPGFLPWRRYRSSLSFAGAVAAKIAKVVGEKPQSGKHLLLFVSGHVENSRKDEWTPKERRRAETIWKRRVL